jgi:YidC/Oxa1 family membrane protein insertase
VANNLRNDDSAKQTSNKLLVALVISLGLLFVVDYLEQKYAPAQAQTLETTTNPLTPNKAELFNQKTPVLEKAEPVHIKTAKYTAEIDLVGGKITSLELNDYVKEKGGDELVSIFNKKQEDEKTAMLFDAGWLANKFTSPDANTQWKLISQNDESIVLEFEANGVVFTRSFEFNQDNYTTKIVETVKNNSGHQIQLAHYSQLHHIGEREDKLANSFTNYTGPEALVDDEKTQADYAKLKDGDDFEATGKNMWAAITRQYFAAAIIPQNNQENNVKFKYNKIGEDNYYTTLVRSPVLTVENGQAVTQEVKLYAGPKSTHILEKQPVAEEIKLAAMLDYGWFHVIAKALYDAIMWFNQYVNSLAISIVIVTILLKIGLFPLANKSYVSMAKMRKIQPEMQKLQEKYGSDRQALGLEMMKLYKKHEVSPASGCWPIFLQIPIFFAMYKVILMSFEFRQAELGLWITDMSMKDPFFVLPILMGLSMIVQQKMNPQPLDETQKMVMNIMPIAFTALFLFFPAGLVFYWLTNNVLSIVQQYFIMKKHGA